MTFSSRFRFILRLRLVLYERISMTRSVWTLYALYDYFSCNVIGPCNILCKSFVLRGDGDYLRTSAAENNIAKYRPKVDHRSPQLELIPLSLTSSNIEISAKNEFSDCDLRQQAFFIRDSSRGARMRLL